MSCFSLSVSCFGGFSLTICKISKKFGHTQEHIAELPKNLDVATS